MININKFREVSFFKFLTLFIIYMLFVNHIFLYKGIFLGFLETNSLSFSTLFFAIMCIFLSSLFASVFCIVFLPYLLKPFAIFVIIVSSICSYFMSNYGVIINKEMLLNVLHTDNKEAFSYLSTNLVLWFVFATILPCIYVIFVKIDYGSFKNSLKIRLKIIAFSIVTIAIIFSLTSKNFHTIF